MRAKARSALIAPTMSEGSSMEGIHRCAVSGGESDMRAVATLNAEQVQRMFVEDKGDVLVDVVVTDESGESPIVCEMVWAWVPKKRKEA